MWRRKWVKKLARERSETVAVEALRDLIAALQAVAVVGLPIAYRLGYQQYDLTERGRRLIEETLRSNEDFLTDSLAPSLLQQLDSLEEWTEEIIAALLLARRYRIRQYAQPYWVLIWEGLGEQFSEAPPQERDGAIWHLDPDAQHCSTCPVKARRYDTWQDMMDTCGGVPGSFDANDECGPGCRCWLEVVYKS